MSVISAYVIPYHCISGYFYEDVECLLKGYVNIRRDFEVYKICTRLILKREKLSLNPNIPTKNS